MENKEYRIDEVSVNGKPVENNNIIFEVFKSICRISYNFNNNFFKASGFFIKYDREENDPLFCLMTNEHVIQKEMIESKTEITIKYKNEKKQFQIILDKNKRKIRNFKYMDIDASLIEILPKDNVKEKYFLLPYNFTNKDYNQFINKKIIILQYPGDKPLTFEKGEIISVDSIMNELKYKVNTESGASGSPIFLENSKKVIGIHKQGNIKELVNYGNFLLPIISSLENDLPYLYIRDIDYEGEFKKKYQMDKDKKFKNDYEFLKEAIKMIKREGYGKMTLLNGEIYIGQWKDDKINGKGTIYYKDKDGKKYLIRYRGEFVNNKFEGQGILYDNERNYYKGSFMNNLKFGYGEEYNKDGTIKYKGNFAFGQYDDLKGKAYLTNGWEYEGEFIGGTKNGKGKIYDNNSLIFEGDINNNIMDGFFTLDNGNTFYGTLIDGKMDGKGLLYENNRLIYEGEFFDSKYHGKGKLFKKNGDIYEGDFVNDKFHGKGKLILKEGSYYIGEFNEGVINGKGKIFSKEGKIKYEGDFLNGNCHGKGIEYFENGEYYDGDFVNNKKQGKGVFYYSNNHTKYNGEFYNDTFEGNGYFYETNGDYYIGEFKKGVKEGKGMEFYKNGDIKFDGNFSNDLYEGKGIFYDEQRNYYEVNFKNGLKHGEGIVYKDGKSEEITFVDDKPSSDCIII